MTGRTRRALLRIGGTAITTALAGCASVAERVANSSGGTSGTPTSFETPQAGGGNGTAARRQETPPGGRLNGSAAAESGGERSGQRAGASAGRNVSGPGSASESTPASTPKPLGELDVRPSEVDVSGLPMPGDPSRYGYARIGSDDAMATATLFGNWKCPYTRAFVLGDFETVLQEYVEPGDLAVRFRAVGYLDGDPFLGSDAPRAARAGLAVWNADPATYWRYFGTVFTNQPDEHYEWATADRLVRLAKKSGVGSTDDVRRAITAGTYADRVRRTSDAMAHNDLATVPRIVAGGRNTAPTVDFSATRRQLDALVGR
ncbi:MAG: DsbA family protein [Salinigranum sp.]